MNTDPYSWKNAVDFALASVEVQGLPLPTWAGAYVGVIIPNDFPRDPNESPEWTLAAYLNGRGTA